MIQTNPIQEIISCKEWRGPKGTLWFHRLRIGDQIADVGKKKPDAFHVGQELTYELEETEQGLKLKEIREEFRPSGGGQASGGGKSFGDPKAMILSYSKDVCVAQLANGVFSEAYADGYPPDLAGEIIATATRFMDWYNGTDTVSAMPTHTGPDDEPATSVVQGSPPEVEAQRDSEPQEARPSAVSDAMQTRKKPDRGSGGKAPSQAQVTLFNKVCRENSIDPDQLAHAEWPEIENASQLSSWAVSYLLDLFLKK